MLDIYSICKDWIWYKNEVIHLSIFDKCDIASFEIDDKYYSLSHNPMKASKDKNDRLKLIEKTEDKLQAIKKLKRDYSPKEIQDKR